MPEGNTLRMPPPYRSCVVASPAPALEPELILTTIATRCCGRCRHWAHDKKTFTVPDRGPEGTCHRYPPTVEHIDRDCEGGVVEHDQRVRSWPCMMADEVCGEWAAKER